jgi:hypothetical protein
LRATCVTSHHHITPSSYLPVLYPVWSGHGLSLSSSVKQCPMEVFTANISRGDSTEPATVSAGVRCHCSWSDSVPGRAPAEHLHRLVLHGSRPMLQSIDPISCRWSRNLWRWSSSTGRVRIGMWWLQILHSATVVAIGKL